MAKMLFKLGRFAGSNSKKVILAFILLMAVLGGLIFSMGTGFKEDVSIPGTESEKAMKILEEKFTGGAQGGQVDIVFKAPGNEALDSAENKAIISKLLTKIQEDKAVTSVKSPYELANINPDKQIGYAVVTYNSSADNVTQESKDKVEESLAVTRDQGIETGLSGTVKFEQTKAGGGPGEIMGVALAYVILALTFASLLVAGMPILMALIGVGIGVLLILLGTNFFDISSISLTLAGMLGIAVGIDYSLFIFSRFKQQLKKGFSVQESIAIANGTAGNAVIFAGLTVIIALLGLMVVNIPFMTTMGIATAVVVLMSIIVAVVVVPAILGIMGHRVKPEKGNRFLLMLTRANKKKESDTNAWSRFVTKNPLIVAVVGIALLSVMAIPFFHLNLGLPDDGNKQYETSERLGYDLLSDAYGAGFHSTLVVIAEPVNQEAASAEKLKALSETINGLDHVKSASPAMPNKTNDMFLMSVTPEDGPNAPETKDLVNEIRDLSDNGSMELLVTGATAVNIDISEQIMSAMPIFAILIVAFAFVLMMVVFRSLLVPLKAVLGFVLSIGATLGFTVFIVQDGNFLDVFGLPGASAILFLLPVLCIGILFGLSMDYEVFLVSRMREEYVHTGDAKKAIHAGLKENGAVVTAAGLIMISVFSGFIFSHDPTIKQMGLALAVGVLFDAFVVRLAIVPAVMTLMGKSAWYFPKWLDRILPNFDIEGETLMNEYSKSSGETKSFGAPVLDHKVL
ncbi:MMPL family transporter [Paenibacillus sp. NFR01]|uniref:MMPL family transporter n=1 Tax=Paenibacillus sp. NFR01 TaxID=1566279 RepID=UPI0008C5F67B|nr:MMPL family transporter [Paenibacillus sp. NFR01]SET04272.1 putative drug exporter of the RND superfamily [Paenibacillus sp. NFR01]